MLSKPSVMVADRLQ